ncbi:hypothetical protein NDU88_006427 [Pleurodeles waltl]|uniref:Uncharacterized protein n=1 Tax=Pleurodeles waltl TaxID=8319 RepID=A0AAV7MFQ4_PLEWA|nr:hypothetical protein NDU88_006427 [Pleurodeles waltl]
MLLSTSGRSESCYRCTAIPGECWSRRLRLRRAGEEQRSSGGSGGGRSGSWRKAVSVSLTTVAVVASGQE